MAVTGHLEAMQLRLKWVQWVRKGGSKALHAELQKAFAKGGMKNANNPYATVTDELIELAEGTYFVAPAFCQLVAHLAQTIPDDVKFSDQWLPTDSGFIIFAETPTINLKGINFPCPTAVTYAHLGFLDPAGQNAREVERRAFTYYRKGEEGLLPGVSVRLEEGWTLADSIRHMKHDFMSDPSRMEYFHNQLKIDLEEIWNDLSSPAHYIFALFSLFGQKLATFRQERPPRAQRRQMEREQISIPPLIQVVTLRRLENQGIRDKNAEHQPVDWQWQWLVNTHWRRQYYPSTGEHKYITIDTYVKGPDDKPLKPPRARVFMVRR